MKQTLIDSKEWKWLKIKAGLWDKQIEAHDESDITGISIHWGVALLTIAIIAYTIGVHLLAFLYLIK